MIEAPRYRAFISYSHRDKAWGAWLHTALETYRVPKGLVGRESRDGVVPTRLYPIFRDREELPVSADLGSNIAEALAASSYLVVVCSPNAAASRWVNEEILTFKRLGRANRVLALIVDGEPNAMDGKPGISPGAECFPPGLRFQVGEDGALSDLRSEPIAADAREDKDGKHNAKLKLIAGLLGVNFDDLRQRENERRVRRLRRLVAATTVVLSLFAAIGVYAGWQATIARRERARADEKLAGAYTLRARQAAAEGDDMSAAVLYAEAYRSHPAEWTAANAASATRSVAVLRARFPADEPALWDEMASDGARAFAWRFDGPLSVIDLKNAQVVGTLPLNKQSEVRSIVWSPDRRLLATLGIDEIIRLWRGATLEALFTISEPATKFIEVSFSQDGRELIAWDERTERRWSVERGDPIGPPRAAGLSIVSVSVSPDRSHALLRDGKKHVQFWNVTSRIAVGGPRNIQSTSVAWSADSTSLAISESTPETSKARDGDVSLWDANTGRRRLTLASAGTVHRFSPTGALLLTSRSDQTSTWLDPEHGAELRLWNASTGAPVGQPIRSSQDVWSAVFSPDSRYLAAASNDTDVRLWSVPDGKPVATLRHPQSVSSIEWPTLTTMLCQGLSEFSVWDVSARFAEPRNFPMSSALDASGFSNDGSRLFAGGQMWDAATLAPVGGDIRHDYRQTFRGFSADSKYAFSVGLNLPAGTRVTGNELMFARVWNAATGAAVGPPLPLAELWNYTNKITFSPDDARLITWMGDALQVRTIATGELVGKPVRGVKVEDLALSPDGTEILAVTDGTLARRWRAASGEVVDPGWPTEFMLARILPIANRVITTAPLRLWELAAKKVISALRGSGDVTSIAFSPDQRMFALADRAGIRRWNSATGAEIGQAVSPGADVSALSFSADGRWLAIAGHDNIVRIVDAGTGEMVGAPVSTPALVDMLAFEPNGRRLLTGSPERGARLIDVSYLYDRADPDQLLRRLQVSTGLQLSARGEIESIPAAEWAALKNRRD